MPYMSPALRLLFPAGLDPLRAYFAAPAEHDVRLGVPVARNVDGWLAKLEATASSEGFWHDEPWLTLVALFGLLGDQTTLHEQRRVDAVQTAVRHAFAGRAGVAPAPCFARLTGCQLELSLRENRCYRRYLQQSVFQGQPWHLYADHRKVLATKLERNNSLEGNTQLDTLLSGKDASGRWQHLFVEAKFNSDISKDISYVPVRNQVARTIDCAIDALTDGGRDLGGLADFWFVLLTPGLFRTRSFGGPTAGPMAALAPDRSRLYCYKMDDYLNPRHLAADLPHWRETLSEADWQLVASRIGWLTFEDLAGAALGAGCVPPDQRAAFTALLAERGLALP